MLGVWIPPKFPIYYICEYCARAPCILWTGFLDLNAGGWQFKSVKPRGWAKVLLSFHQDFDLESCWDLISMSSPAINYDYRSHWWARGYRQVLVSGQLRKVACGDATSRGDASSEWLLRLPVCELLRGNGQEGNLSANGLAWVILHFQRDIGKEEEITASSFNRGKLPVNERDFWQVKQLHL